MVNIVPKQPLPNIKPDEIVISVGGQFYAVPKTALQPYKVVDQTVVASLKNLGNQIQAGSVAPSVLSRGDFVAGVRG